jgi:DNA-binding IscR family transcriptional regulator
VNTNPVVVRRIIQELARAGLLRTKLGKGGGSVLARPAGRIDLFQIYQAVRSDSVFDFNPARPNEKCPLSCRMKALLVPVFDSIDRALEEKLRKVKLEDLIRAVR